MNQLCFCFLLALLFSYQALAADKLIIISPHRKSIQKEFIPAFKEDYKKRYKTTVDVSWIDQGGTSDDIRFVDAKFKKNPKSAGIDIFWGGGSATFISLMQEGYLEKYKLSDAIKKDFPASVAGTALYDNSQTWFATAMSSFGIFYNKPVIKMEGLKEPKTWADLAAPKFFGLVSVTDPRRSGTAATMNAIMIQALGWEKGSQLLTELGANAKSFTHSSSDPIKSTVSGDVAASLAIDFYASAKIADLGPKKLGYVLPEGQTVIDPDPVAILKGAPNEKTAKRFIDFLLTEAAQKLLVLKKGEKDGPKINFLGRMSVLKSVYNDPRLADQVNPFGLKAGFDFDAEESAKVKKIMNDLIGSVIVDSHTQLREAWAAIKDKKNNAELKKQLSKWPVTEKEFNELAKKWDDNVLRNKKINEWVSYSRKNYTEIKTKAAKL